jgi:hypothetical protein
MDDVNFLAARTFRDQVHVACTHLRAFVDHKRMTFRKIGRFLGDSDAARIAKQYEKSCKDPQMPGRPRLLKECELDMINLIASQQQTTSSNHCILASHSRKLQQINQSYCFSPASNIIKSSGTARNDILSKTPAHGMSHALVDGCQTTLPQCQRSEPISRELPSLHRVEDDTAGRLSIPSYSESPRKSLTQPTQKSVKY